MTSLSKYLLLSAISGMIWGGVVTWIAVDMVPRAIWGGLVASPIIGCIIGASTKRWYRLPLPFRIVASLGSLYVATALFGFSVRVYDWLAFDMPNRLSYGVVLESLLAFLWGLTFVGWLVLFWPLAYVTHWLLGRISPARQLARSN